METAPKPAFTLQNVDLLTVNFRRDDELVNAGSVQNRLQIHTAYRTELPYLFVTLEAEIWQEQDGKRPLEITVKMGGQFLVAEGTDQTILENFADINGPAILFPFVRELIASLTTRAGIPTVLVQPLNFMDMAQRRQQSQPAE